MAMTTALEAGRPPQQLRQDLWLFPPNRDCQGGSSWWLDVEPEQLQTLEERFWLPTRPIGRSWSFLVAIFVDRKSVL